VPAESPISPGKGPEGAGRADAGAGDGFAEARRGRAPAAARGVVSDENAAGTEARMTAAPKSAAHLAFFMVHLFGKWLLGGVRERLPLRGLYRRKMKRTLAI
jgi:hypothetical protein